MRPPRDITMLKMALTLAEQSTCARRAVGCILTNKRHEIVGSGYNGRPSGDSHCNEGHPCEGANAASGTKLDSCEAIHAEVNALIQCTNRWDIHTCYVSCSPCIGCVKPLLNTSCKRIVFAEEYPHIESRRLWCREPWCNTEYDKMLGGGVARHGYVINDSEPEAHLKFVVPLTKVYGYFGEYGRRWIHLPITKDWRMDSDSPVKTNDAYNPSANAVGQVDTCLRLGTEIE